jgi:hypothetical protein
MTAKTAALSIVLSSVAALATPPPSTPGSIDISTKALTDRAAAYVADYQTKFAFLVAQENYTQTVTHPGQPLRRRVMSGEMFLTFLRTDRDWIAVHDVAEVDGAPVPDRENLQTLLQRADITTVGRQIANRNAAFNIGSVGRNFNEPTLALLVLEAKHVSRFRFDRRDLTDQSGVQIATLAFSEHDGPTLIHGIAHNTVFAKGQFIVETATGRIRSSTIAFDEDKIEATLQTDYVHEPRLDLWVPATFTERYNDVRDRKAPEVTSCLATYSNYRRFEVTGRIKKQP